jgi:hypothetical protein
MTNEQLADISKYLPWVIFIIASLLYPIVFWSAVTYISIIFYMTWWVWLGIGIWYGYKWIIS